MDGTARGDVAPPFRNSNHSALAKHLIPVEDVPLWLRLHDDYICDGMPANADTRNNQTTGQLWVGVDKCRPHLSDITEGSRVKMDFDQDDSSRPNTTWVIFNIDVLTGMLEVFKDGRKSPLSRDIGKRRQYPTIKNMENSVAHLILVYSILNIQASLSGKSESSCFQRSCHC